MILDKHKKRTYDIGGGVIIEDDGHHLCANVKLSETSSRSCGVSRLRLADLPQVGAVRALESRDGRYFYLSDFAFIYRNWMSKEKFQTEEAAKKADSPGMFGPSGICIAPKGEDPYYRRTLSFTEWDVKANPEEQAYNAETDDRVKDFLSCVAKELLEDIARFNEAISPSGRTHEWLMDRIGEWVPIPEVETLALHE